ncbi:MAG: oligosaccharide flippase family protein, partial [Clostridia bacterium]|nr:oligosaccharide flippase family protein [Clostridia bacterium]
MKEQSLKIQTAVMTGCNMVIRGLGFILRMITARLLGPEAVGVMELAGQAHMLALTPAASGLPGAVSRMVAKDAEKAGVLLTARKMVMRLGLLLGVLLLLFSPLIAGWMGDERTLPSLLLFSPCILIIGLSGVYRGYSLGIMNDRFAPSV